MTTSRVSNVVIMPTDMAVPKISGEAVVTSMRWVIFPGNKYIKKWDLAVLVCLAILAFTLPYQIGVSRRYVQLGGKSPVMRSWFVVNLVINLVCLVDTFIPFFRAYRTKDGSLIWNLRTIQKRYLKGLFIPNLLSVLPFTLIFYTLRTSTALIVVSGILKLVRFLRVRQIIESSDFINYFRLSHDTQSLRLCEYMMSVILLTHYYACIWVFVAFFDPLKDEPNWIRGWHAENYVEGGPDPFGEGGSIDSYVLGLFWAIQTITSIGYGNIVPITRLEWWVGCVLQLLAGFLWTYLIGCLVGIAAGMQANEEIYRGRTDEANVMIRGFENPLIRRAQAEKESSMKVSNRRLSLEDNIPSLALENPSHAERADKEDFAKHIRIYLDKQHRHLKLPRTSTSSLSDIFPVVETLPPWLQKMSHLLIMQKYLELVPYLSTKFLDLDEQCRLAMECKLLDFSAGERIDAAMEGSEVERGIFVFQRGCALTKIPDFKNLKNRVLVLTAGSVFGTGKVLIENGDPGAESTLSFLTYSSALFIPRTAVLRVLQKNALAWKRSARWIYLRTSIRHGKKKSPEESV